MQITSLNFNIKLHPSRIPNFRAAIVEQVGIGHQLFHGHDNSEPGELKYSNAYPLIRFGVRKGKAQITGIGEGGDALIRHLLPVLPDLLYIAGEPYSMKEYRLNNIHWEPRITSEYYAFGLYKWMALNKDNYLAWKAYEGKESARRLILDKCLTGHLRALAEAADPSLDRSQIVARSLRVDNIKCIKWHDNSFVVFNLVAEANFLPLLGWGLGRCISFGFGEICSERSYRALTMMHHKKKIVMAI